jgi:hypothetical protein
VVNKKGLTVVNFTDLGFTESGGGLNIIATNGGNDAGDRVDFQEHGVMFERVVPGTPPGMEIVFIPYNSIQYIVQSQ